MLEQFPDWYREVDLDPEPEVIDRRAKGIDAVIESLSKEDALELVRLMYDFPLTNKYRETFSQKFRSVDTSFPMKDNARELEVLAASTVAQLYEENGGVADLAIFATLCGSFLVGDMRPPASEILKIAQNKLISHAAEQRQTSSLSELEQTSFDLEKQITQLADKCQNNNLKQASDPLSDLLRNITTACAQFEESVREVNVQMQRQIQLFSEETNILWWVIGESSHDLECGMDQFQVGAACVIAGKELGDLVLKVPGPTSAKALLHRMVASIDEELPDTIDIRSGICACPRHWRKDEFDEDIIDTVGALCPIHCAVKTSLKTDANDDWWPVYTKLTGAESSCAKKPLEVALQTYRERLMLKKVQD